MKPEAYAASLPLAERMQRRDPQLAAQIYSQPVLDYLRDGVIILPGVIDSSILDALEADLQRLRDLKQQDPILGCIEIDGPEKYYKARYLRNLSISDFGQEPPGLKLVDLQRFFEPARQLAFSPAITAFLEEFFGSPAALIQSLTFWKSSEQPIHQDFSYVHHHRRLGELAAAWIPLEDIDGDAGPLIYYKGSHRPDQVGFFDWGDRSILASRDADPALFAAYTRHLQEIIAREAFEPSLYLPRRGDLLIWHGALIHGGTPMRNPALTRRSFVCHYTSMASHRQAQRYRIADGFSFDQPPSLPYQPSRPRRILNRIRARLGGGAAAQA